MLLYQGEVWVNRSWTLRACVCEPTRQDNENGKQVDAYAGDNWGVRICHPFQQIVRVKIWIGHSRQPTFFKCDKL